MSHVFYVPNPTQPQGHGTYSPYNEIFRNIPVLISFDVSFDSDIAEKATLTIDGRKYTNVTFPYTTKIRRGFDETVVKAESPAYTTETVIINKSFNAVSVINLLNILGWGIDAATGAMTKPEFKFYQIDFQPKEEKSIKQD